LYNRYIPSPGVARGLSERARIERALPEHTEPVAIDDRRERGDRGEHRRGLPEVRREKKREGGLMSIFRGALKGFGEMDIGDILMLAILLLLVLEDGESDELDLIIVLGLFLLMGI